MLIPDLGDKDDLRFTLANAATGISTDETEANNAGGADLPVATGSICDPLKCLGTNSTAIIHCFSSLLCQISCLVFSNIYTMVSFITHDHHSYPFPPKPMHLIVNELKSNLIKNHYSIYLSKPHCGNLYHKLLISNLQKKKQ